jgi:methionyl-tRNA synthetase
MYVALQIATGLAVLSEPFLPFTSDKLKKILRVAQNDKNEVISNESEKSIGWSNMSSEETLLPAGHQINPSELLFRKIEDAEIQQQLDKLEATKKVNAQMDKAVTPEKDTITFDDFTKLDMRVGTIVEAEKMPKANKLLVLKVDTGLDTRTIVSGIAESFKPEDIVGKKVTVLVNLAPRKLRGVESQGMILMTENQEGKLVFVNPDEDGVGNGEGIS